MGRFFLMVVVLAACGDNLPPDDDGVPSLDKPDRPIVAPRYVPAVCGVRAGDPSSSTDISVSVATLGHGAAMFTVPNTGGAIDGYLIDPRMNVSAPTQLAIAGTFASASASVVDSRVVSTAIDGSGVRIDLLDADLGNPQYIATVAGTHVAEPSFYYAGNDLVMPVAGDDGLWLHRLADSFEPLGSTQLLATDPVRALAATQLSTAMLATWSTDTDCYLMLTSRLAPGPYRHIAEACAQPRVAADPQTNIGVMVYAGVGGVQMMRFMGQSFDVQPTLVRESSRAPRVVWDGKRFWISFLDVRGDVIVGFLDDRGEPVTMSLAGPQPDKAGFELAVVNGLPWVITLDATGYTAHQMCAVVEGTTQLELDSPRGQAFEDLWK